MKKIQLLSIVAAFFMSFGLAYGQSEDSNIKSAKGTASSGIGSNADKFADSTAWKAGGDVAVNFAQTYLNNWSAGGENSIAISGTVNLFANYKKNKFIWQNSAFMTYGMLKSGDHKAIKNTDQFDIASRAGYEMAKNWYYSFAFLGKTQFSPGYKYSSSDTIRISDFLAPAYLYLSLGVDYKPNSMFSVSISPLMGKATLVRSNDRTVMKTAGLNDKIIDAGKHARYEFGGGIIFNLQGDLLDKRVTYNTQLELFSNYLEKPQNVDMIWDLQFRIALTKFISAGLRLNMIYDDDQKTMVDGIEHGAKLQVKEYFEIGLFYAF